MPAGNQIDQAMLEVLVKIRPNARLSQAIVEYIADVANRSIRNSELVIEYVIDVENNRDIRTSELIIEVLHVALKPDVYLDEFAECDFAW